MKILIGFNGSEAATSAVHDLRYAGLPDDTEVVLLTVAESWLPPKTVEEAISISAAAKAAISDEFPNWIVTAKTASGSPPREIIALAEPFEPDLIVVGEPRQPVGEHKMFLGHTSQTLLTEAVCSIRISRGQKALESRPAKILVGFDGSPGATLAIDSLLARSWRAGTEVRLLAVADSSVLTSIGRFTPQMNDTSIEARFALQWAESLASTSLKRLKNAGLIAHVEVRLGRPKDALIAAAENWEADAIFVGPHCSLNSFERFSIGSVSADVAARAHCSVEVVKPRGPQ
ncbi:MAG: universal stress protein [Pyrinomonadaceae bacterium]